MVVGKNRDDSEINRISRTVDELNYLVTMTNKHGTREIYIISRINSVSHRFNYYVGSCHHGMVRPLGCGWGNRPPYMEVSCEYIE